MTKLIAKHQQKNNKGLGKLDIQFFPEQMAIVRKQDYKDTVIKAQNGTPINSTVSNQDADTAWKNEMRELVEKNQKISTEQNATATWEQAVQNMLKYNPIYNAGTLSEVESRPSYDTYQARMRIKEMIPNKKLREAFLLNTIDKSTRFADNYTENEYNKISKLYDIWQASGKPKIRKTNFFTKLFLPYRDDKSNSHYNFHSNNIRLSTKAPHLIEELSHALQFKHPELKDLIGQTSGLFDLIKNGDQARYSRPGNTEYLAHTIIQPYLEDYVNGKYTNLNDVINVIKQEYAEDRKEKNYKQGGKMNTIEFLKNGSGIHIKKKNRGKFTSYCGGKVTDSCIQKAKASGNPTLVKRATFAQNARKWKHSKGGNIHKWSSNFGRTVDSNPNLDNMKGDYVSKKLIKKKK